jgi:hypothetical protein
MQGGQPPADGCADEADLWSTLWVLTAVSRKENRFPSGNGAKKSTLSAAAVSAGGGQIAGAGDCPQAGSGCLLALLWRSVSDERPGGPGPEGR